MSVGGIGSRVGGIDGGTTQDVGATTGVGAGAAETPGLRSRDLSGSAELGRVMRGETTLEKGGRGEGVKAIQEGLVRLGLLPARPGADGVFGTGTANALAAFQRQAGLPTSGKLDASTLAKLDTKLYQTPAPPRPAPSPLTKQPATYLTSEAERAAYASIERKLWTGTSWARGIDLAVTDEDTKAILDELDKLTPASYNRVLHALAATKGADAATPTLLDKLVVRGTSGFGGGALSVRFCEQLEKKCGALGSTPENKILSHISPDSVDRLKSWAGWGRLARLFQ